LRAFHPGPANLFPSTLNYQPSTDLSLVTPLRVAYLYAVTRLRCNDVAVQRFNASTLQRFNASTLHRSRPRQLHFRSHRRKFVRAFIETPLEILRNIRVEWIRRQIRRQRAVTPMLVHPEPGGGIFPDNRLELVPASLRHFLERSAGGKFNPGMKNHAVTPAEIGRASCRERGEGAGMG